MMKRAVLRLKGGKGSVLFFIIAIMSVMIVLASAVYYSTVSARKQVEIEYGDEQSYQSAIALNNIISDYITKKPNSDFVKTIAGMKTNGETIVSTSADGIEGFSELAPGLGDYKITVTKVADGTEEGTKVVRITTDVTVNGEKSTISTVGEFKVKEEAYNFDRFFTSTGYAPNDVYMSGMDITSTMYLDNEYSQVGGEQGGSHINLYSEIIAAGTLKLNNAPINSGKSNNPIDLTVGNNLYLSKAAGDGLNLQGGTLRVGGSVAQLSNCFPFRRGNMYYIMGDYYGACASTEADLTDMICVDGDFVVFGNMKYSGKLYVNGNVYVDKSHNQGLISNQMYVGGNIYFSPGFGNMENYVKHITFVDSDGSKHTYSNLTDAKASGRVVECASAITLTLDEKATITDLKESIDDIKAVNGNGGYTYVWPSQEKLCDNIDDVKAEINRKIGDPKYINWNIESKFKNGETLKEATNIEYKFVDYKAEHVVTLSAKDKTEYVMGNIKFPINYDNFGIIFDTDAGGGTYKDIYVYLKPNCEYYEENGQEKYRAEDPTKYNCFMWNPPKGSSYVGEKNNNPFHVFVKGKGSLILVLPDGVKYVANWQSYVGHIAIYEKITGKTVTAANSLDAIGAFGGIKGKINDILINDKTSKKNACFTDEFINETGDSGTKTYVHNNVFLVTIDKNAAMNFQPQQNMFAGFIYAPYMTFEASSEGGQAGMLGGMIVSDYTMKETSNTYMCTIPYDYYDRFVTPGANEAQKEEERLKYMEKLMAESGCTTTIGSSVAKTWRVYGYN